MIKRIFRDSYYSYKALFSYYGVVPYFLYKIINSFFQIAFFSLFAISLFGKENATNWIVGNAFMLSSCNSLFGIGVNATYERIFGTLKYTITGSTDIFSRYCSQVIMHLVDGLFNIMLGVMYGAVCFGVNISIFESLRLLLVAFVSMLSISGFSLFLGNIGLLIRDMTSVLNFVNMFIMICAGVNYPIETLPKLLKTIGRVLPLSGGIEAARAVINQQTEGVPIMLFREFSVCLFYVALAIIIYKLIENSAIKNGKIDLM
ncbi:ABC transporter permease [Levyella massiliensis]|uniref:ABC transporter permease n=1 Tax=Levyella massiliensis TaxID=938289 RepID=UPI00037FD315|nr:ABC transporter permease [Levyella massiliensis]